MAAGQQDGSGSFSLARPGVYLSCGNEIYISTVPRSFMASFVELPSSCEEVRSTPSLVFLKGQRMSLGTEWAEIFKPTQPLPCSCTGRTS